MRPNATEQTQHDPRRPAEELVGLPMVLQPLSPFLPPILSHNILSFLAMLLRLHPLLLQEFLRAFTLARGVGGGLSSGGLSSDRLIAQF